MTEIDAGPLELLRTLCRGGGRTIIECEMRLNISRNVAIWISLPKKHPGKKLT